MHHAWLCNVVEPATHANGTNDCVMLLNLLTEKNSSNIAARVYESVGIYILGSNSCVVYGCSSLWASSS
jgi:hypothetical protein